MDDEASCTLPLDQFQELCCDDDFGRVILPWGFTGVFGVDVGVQRHVGFQESPAICRRVFHANNGAAIAAL